MRICEIYLSHSYIIAGTVVNSQILNETFNDRAGFTTPSPFFSDGGADYFGLAVVNDYNDDEVPSGLHEYTGFNGGFLTGMDLDGEGAAIPFVITWTEISISGATGLTFTGQFDEFLDEPGYIDAVNFIRVENQISRVGHQNLIAFEGADFTDGTLNGNFREDTNFDGEGDGTLLKAATQAFVKAITGTGTTMDLRMKISLWSMIEPVESILSLQP